MALHSAPRSMTPTSVQRSAKGGDGAQEGRSSKRDAARGLDFAAGEALLAPGPDSAPLQLKRSGAGKAEDVGKTAAGGFSGGGQELPVRKEIEASYGADLSGVRAHMGGAAAQACEGLGASGYASGQDIAFAGGSPSKHLVAHEAAHVVQQKAGVHLSSKVGKAGDSYEVNADAAADRVVAGQSARDLLPGAGAGGASASAASGPVQLRRESKDNPDWTSSDKGKVLMTGEQDLYASEDLIKSANKALAKVGKDGSYITLSSDGQKYDHEGKTLTKVHPLWVDHPDMGDHQTASDMNELSTPDHNGETTESTGGKMALEADCGRSSGAITGSKDKNNRDRAAKFKKKGKKQETKGRLDANQNSAAKNSVGRMANDIYFQVMPGFVADKKNKPFLKKDVHYTENGKKTVPKVPADGVEAQKMYGELTEAGKLAFDKATGINDYANPDIGEAYAMGTGYDMPGFKKHKGHSAWNFHWAGVIMKDGSDNVTLENYAVIRKGIDSVVNRRWNYAIYGTVKKDGSGRDQTFHHDHLASKTHGTKATSMAIKTDKK
ncbi:MAG: DUF4157 domain-containing protein [Myxococcota bacterium]